MLTQDKSLDSRTKLIIVICISSLSVFIGDPVYLISILAAALIISKMLKSELFMVIKKLRKILGIFIAMIIIQSLFIEGGNSIITIGNISLLTDVGILRALEFLIRISIILVSASILMTSTSREIIQGLVEWKIPYEIAFMVSVGIRFLPLLSEEIQDTLTAIQLRGIDMEKLSLDKKIQIYSHIFTPVVAGAVLKSQRLAVAMECRGFRAFKDRTSYLKLRMKARDYAISVSSIVISVLVAYGYMN